MKNIEPCLNCDNVKLYQGNNLDILDELPEESVDLIFADPPYLLSSDGITCESGKMVSVNKGNWDKSKGVSEDYKFHYDWIQACKRVLKKDGSIWITGTYHSIYFCGTSLILQDWRILNEIIWYKINPPPNLSCRMFTASHETIIWASKNSDSRHVFNYDVSRNGNWPNDFLKIPNKQMKSVWSIKRVSKYEKRYGKHPTQKPEELIRRIILTSSNEGDLILDPFCGSGTTGVVALENKRNFIGIDIDTENIYLENITKPRLMDAMKYSKSPWREVT